jgi:hypothetical protein
VSLHAASFSGAFVEKASLKGTAFDTASDHPLQ